MTTKSKKPALVTKNPPFVWDGEYIDTVFVILIKRAIRGDDVRRNMRALCSDMDQSDLLRCYRVAAKALLGNEADNDKPLPERQKTRDPWNDFGANESKLSWVIWYLAGRIVDAGMETMSMETRIMILFDILGDDIKTTDRYHIIGRLLQVSRRAVSNTISPRKTTLDRNHQMNHRIEADFFLKNFLPDNSL